VPKVCTSLKSDFYFRFHSSLPKVSLNPSLKVILIDVQDTSSSITEVTWLQHKMSIIGMSQCIVDVFVPVYQMLVSGDHWW